jgi:hypothetical protein
LTCVPQITIATSMTLRVGSMAEQTFNAVERVDEYCHLPEEAAYELDPSAAAAAKKAASGANRSSGNSGGAGGGAAAAPGAGRTKQRSKAGAGGLKEPLLPVVNGDSVSAAGNSSSSSNAGPLVVVEAGVPEGWPREGSIEFANVKSR